MADKFSPFYLPVFVMNLFDATDEAIREAHKFLMREDGIYFAYVCKTTAPVDPLVAELSKIIRLSNPLLSSIDSAELCLVKSLRPEHPTEHQLDMMYAHGMNPIIPHAFSPECYGAIHGSSYIRDGKIYSYSHTTYSYQERPVALPIHHKGVR